MKNDELINSEVSTRAPDQLGIALSRFRHQAGTTQVALAKKAGLRQATISKTEKGVGSTEVGTIFAICAALGLEIILRPRERTVDFRPDELF